MAACKDVETWSRACSCSQRVITFYLTMFCFVSNVGIKETDDDNGDDEKYEEDDGDYNDGDDVDNKVAIYPLRLMLRLIFHIFPVNACA